MAPRRHANRPRPREHSPYWNEVYAPIADLEKWKTDLYRHYLSAEADSDSGNWDLLLADAWVLLEYCEFLDEKLRREVRHPSAKGLSILDADWACRKESMHSRQTHSVC